MIKDNWDKKTKTKNQQQQKRDFIHFKFKTSLICSESVVLVRSENMKHQCVFIKKKLKSLQIDVFYLAMDKSQIPLKVNCSEL